MWPRFSSFWRYKICADVAHISCKACGSRKQWLISRWHAPSVRQLSFSVTVTDYCISYFSFLFPLLSLLLFLLLPDTFILFFKFLHQQLVFSCFSFLLFLLTLFLFFHLHQTNNECLTATHYVKLLTAGQHCNTLHLLMTSPILSTVIRNSLHKNKSTNKNVLWTKIDLQHTIHT